MDKDGNGSISLSEYFGIFEEHGIVVNKTETNRLSSFLKWMTRWKITITQVHKCISVHQSSYQDQSNSILIKVIIQAHFDQNQRTGWSVWLGTMATWPRRASSRYSSHPTSSWRLSTRTRMGLSRRWMWCVVWISIKLVVRVDFHFIHDVPDNSFSPEMRTSYLFSDFTLKVVHFVTIYQPRN